MIFSNPIPLKKQTGFTVLEVLVAMSIMTITLVAIYQAFSTSLFILSSTDNLWKAMNYSQKELLCWERSLRANVSFVQGKFDDNFSPNNTPLCSKYEDESMIGFRWEREITDTYPEGLPGIAVRKISYRFEWDEGQNVYSYNAEIYVKPD